MIKELLQQVYEANMMLPTYNLVTFTWGNVSAIDRSTGIIAIKPSGVPYEQLTIEDLVLCDLSGTIVEGTKKPSSDTLTHIELYKAFPTIGAVVHTHSPWATSWAQAQRGIPCYGTTHADYLYGTVPCCRPLTEKEIGSDYEKQTGLVIVETMRGIDPLSMPAILCANHGPFTWGKKPLDAVCHAVVLEEVAKMAYQAEQLNPQLPNASQALQDKHYFRKHGEHAYYGQK